MKEYFAHDYNASNDLKMQILIQKHGVAAYGFFWILVEAMHQSDGSIAQGRHKAVARMHGVRNANAMFCTMMEVGLFVEMDGAITSMRLQEGLAERARRSDSARNSVKKRYERSTNVEQKAYERTTIKEKESKELTHKNELVERARDRLIPDLIRVKAEFVMNGSTEEEAERFFNHYDAQDWKSGNGQAILKWQAKAKVWISEQRKRGDADAKGKRRGDRNADGSIGLSEYAQRVARLTGQTATGTDGVVQRLPATTLHLATGHDSG